jgi:hypothetical protein
MTSPVLLGDLGGHARGKTLTAALGAVAGAPPSQGLALALGKEAQQHLDRFQEWVDWAREPGRVLVLIPPFQQTPCSVPTAWEARRSEPLAGGESELTRVLARDRQHELRGELVPWERVAGQVVTGVWRRHPAAGLVVVTALPLWSLLVLDHRAAIRAWLDALIGLAGAPRAADEASTQQACQPTRDDWVLLLHLCTGPYTDAPAALTALDQSSIFRLAAPSAEAAMARVQAAGWARGGELTDAGRELLAQGPYATQARALARLSHG